MFGGVVQGLFPSRNLGPVGVSRLWSVYLVPGCPLSLWGKGETGYRVQHHREGGLETVVESFLVTFFFDFNIRLSYFSYSFWILVTSLLT